MVVIKCARVLGGYLHRLAEYGPGFAVNGMAMGGGLDVGTGLVDGGVCGAISSRIKIGTRDWVQWLTDKESGSVDRELRAVGRDVSLGIDKNELGFLLAMGQGLYDKARGSMRTVTEEKWTPMGFILATLTQDRYQIDRSASPVVPRQYRISDSDVAR